MTTRVYKCPSYMGIHTYYSMCHICGIRYVCVCARTHAHRFINPRWGVAHEQVAHEWRVAIALYKHSSSVEFQAFAIFGIFSGLKEGELRHYYCLQKVSTVLVSC